MEKNMSAFFTSSEKANSAALYLSQKSGIKEISIRKKYNKGYITNYAFLFTLIGSVAGLFLFNASSFFSLNGGFSGIFSFSGMLCGAVIGAIAGAFSDIFAKEEFKDLYGIFLRIKNESAYESIKLLKNGGAIQVYFEK